MLIHIRHTTSSYERLMAAATMPFNYKLAALGSFARQAGATFYCVKINQAEETPPTFVTFYFNAAVPLTPEELFPYLLNKDRGGELPALGLTTLAAGLWDVVSTDKGRKQPEKSPVYTRSHGRLRNSHARRLRTQATGVWACDHHLLAVRRTDNLAPIAFLRFPRMPATQKQLVL